MTRDFVWHGLSLSEGSVEGRIEPNWQDTAIKDSDRGTPVAPYVRRRHVTNNAVPMMSSTHDPGSGTAVATPAPKLPAQTR